MGSSCMRQQQQQQRGGSSGCGRLSGAVKGHMLACLQALEVALPEQL